MKIRFCNDWINFKIVFSFIELYYLEIADVHGIIFKILGLGFSITNK
jgi:hypothetical protein